MSDVGSYSLCCSGRERGYLATERQRGSGPTLGQRTENSVKKGRGF